MAQLGFGLNTNEAARDYAYDLYDTSLTETLGAVAEDNWQFNPTVSISNYFDVEQAKMKSKEEGQVPVSRDQLNEQYSDLGLYFAEDEYQSVVDIMADMKRAERERQDIISRGPKGFLPGTAKFITGLGVSLADPINIAASFIPVVGEANFARLVATQGFAKARLIRGAAEGAFGAALVEPIVYNIAQSLQSDYDMMDSFLNITFGTIIGGGLHVGAGALKDMRTASKFRDRVRQAKEDGRLIGNDEPELNLYREYYPENSKFMRDLENTNPHTRRMLLQKSMNDLLTEQPVEVRGVAMQDPILKDSIESSPSPEIRTSTEIPADKIEINNVENNVVNKEITDIDTELETLQNRLNTLRVNQPEINIKGPDDIDEVKAISDDLDQFTAKQKEID